MKILINLQAGSVRVSELRNTLCIRFKGSVGARFTWKPSRWSIPLVRLMLPVGRHIGGICSTRIDFQLGTNAADSNGLNCRKEVCEPKTSSGITSQVLIGSHDRLVMAQNPTVGLRRSSGQSKPEPRVWQGLSPDRLTKCAEKAHRYNCLGGTCAHKLRELSPHCHLALQRSGCLQPKFKSMKNIAFFYW